MKKEKLVKFLEEHGIHNVKEIVYNPTYEELFVEETKPELEGFAEDDDTQNRMAELKDNLEEIVEMYRNGEDISYLRQNIVELQESLELRLREYKRDILL